MNYAEMVDKRVTLIKYDRQFCFKYRAKQEKN